MTNIPQLSFEERSNYTYLITGYFNGICIDERDYSAVGHILRAAFEGDSRNPYRKINGRLRPLLGASDLNSGARAHLLARWESIAEVYDHPMSWIERGKGKQLQRLILEIGQQLANRLENMTPTERAADRQLWSAERSRALANQERFRLIIGQHQLNIQSVISPSRFSTLDETQQHEESQLAAYIVHNDLESLRNPSLPLNEDLNLFERLASADEHRGIFPHLANLLRDAPKVHAIYTRVMSELNGATRSNAPRGPRPNIMQRLYSASVNDLPTYLHLAEPYGDQNMVF